jgi:hypothetical protein
MALNFNVDPYFDDFDPSKNFHRILFKPGVAVQARELTQSQTLLQSQISKFADNIFSQNTPVNGGKVTTNLNCQYLKLNPQFNGVNIVAEDFKNRIIQDATGTILAKVIATAEATGTDVTAGDPPTLIVTYFTGGEFTDAMNIFPTDGSNFAATTIGIPDGTTCTGKASVASISDGVFYVRNGFFTSSTQNDDGTFSKYSIGNFVSVQPQTTILNKYSNVPSFRLGLSITETVADYVDDPSLLDPAVGASNYQAPGADRYQITLSLITLPLELGNDDQFIELVRIENGIIVKQVDSTVYATIDDYFAKRTFDTNGDFVVNDFNLTPVANTSNSAKYDLKIGKGVAYVRGYKIENQSDTTLINDRARTQQTLDNNSVFVDYGSYFYVDTVNGLFDVTTAFPVDLHCIPAANIATANATTYASTLVGTGYIRNMTYDRNTTAANTKSYVFKSFMYNISTNQLNGNVASANATTITLSPTSSGQLSPYANAYYGVVINIPTGTGSGYTGRITAYDPVNKTATVNPTFTIPPDSSSTFSFKFDTFDVDSLANTATGTTTINSSANINASSKSNGVGTGDTILNNPNVPELLYNIGYPYVATLSDSSYSSTKVWRTKAFSGTGTVSLALTLPVALQGQMTFAGGVGALSPDAILQNYTVIVTSTTDTANNGVVGSVMDFTSSGNTVTIAAGANTVTFTSTKYKTPLTVSVISKVNIGNADATDHFLKTKTLVTGNTTNVSISGPDGIIASNTYVDLTAGHVYIKNAALLSTGQPQSLYVTDLKRLIKVIDTKSPGAAATDAMLSDSSYDVTRNFSLNNGQKDGLYDHAFLVLNAGAPKPRGNILVIFDFYTHSFADGYFSVESYVNESYAQIPSYTAQNGKTYLLRDALDFRPSRKNGTSTFDYEYSANPSTNDTGFYIPQDLTNWLSTYSFYYGRKDKLVLTKDKNFQIIQGNPSTNPILPVQPDGSLLIANLTHDPYTAYLPSETPKGVLPNLSLEKVKHRRWTMDDISDLQTRVNNIEYYTTLNLLEQNAQSLQVPDANGLNRFKNGILVDDFSTYAVGDTSNPDFSASIDRIGKKMTAAQLVQNYPLSSINTLNAIGKPSTSANTLGYQLHNIGKGTNIFTLPYTTTPIIKQPLASQTVNLNPFTTPVYQGVCYLNPPMDNWVDNTQEPDLLIVDPNLQIYQESNTLNTLSVTNWQTIPGTQVTSVGPRTVKNRVATQTTTITSTQSQTTTQGYWSNLGSSYSSNNGYITDISIQPYIRSQSLLFKAKGLKLNTPVQTFFDGVSVDEFISNPDVLELTGVTGEFAEDDVIGYKDTGLNKFLPIATVVSIYKYPNSTNVRLYIASNFHTTFGNVSGATTIQNAFFDENGVYVSKTAEGTLPVSSVVSFNNNGFVSSVGGAFTDATLTSKTLYRASHPRYNAFSQAHGVWSTQKKTGNVDISFTVNFPKTATYYFQAVADEDGKVYLDGAEKIDMLVEGTAYLYSQSVTAGDHVVRITANAGSPSDNFIAVAIADTAWTAGKPTTTGNIIFTTINPPAIVPTNVGAVFPMAGGGAYYTGVTQIALSPSAANTDNYYVGTKVNITSTFVSQTVAGSAANRSTQTYKPTITAYNGDTRLATLSSPVNISVGVNTLIGGNITSPYSLSGLKSNYVLAVAQGGHATLSTNENGDFVGIFNVPEGTFRNGDRIFRVDNRTTPNDPGSATTWTEATFTASGLSTRSQSIDFAPSISAAKNVFTKTAQKSLVSTTTVSNPYDPVAQGFIIDNDTYPNGAFISSAKFFFQSKPTTTSIPVTLSIVGTLNGYPNGVTLDHSIVTKTPDTVKASSAPHYLDATTYTEFTFAAPVFIQPGVLYAFILQSASQDYNVYVAAQNSTALASSVKNLPTDETPTNITKIGTSPYVAAMFESQNSITWTADQTKALMFTVNRCVFDTTKSPKIRMVTPKFLPTRKGVNNDIQAFYDSNLINNVDGVHSIVDQPSDAYNISVTDFVPTDTNIGYTYQPTLLSTNQLDSEVAVIPGKFGSPTYDHIYLNDNKGERLLQANNANSFSLFAQLSSSSSALSPIISDDGTSLYNIQWNINNLGLSNSSIALINGGTGYSNNISGNTTVSISAPDIAGGTQAYASANVDGGVIQSVWITTPGSGYLTTPTITVSDANTTPGINASVSAVSEYSPSGGNALARYVTKKTTLSASNDSQDLRVFFTAYRPAGTNIYVFYRVQNRDDSQTFENGTWQLATYVNNTGNGFSTSRDDTLEFEVAPGVNGVADDQISYTSTTGTTYTSYNQFAIKIVFVTSDKTNVPFLTDIRALALPSGTGI